MSGAAVAVQLRVPLTSTAHPEQLVALGAVGVLRALVACGHTRVSDGGGGGGDGMPLTARLVAAARARGDERALVTLLPLVRADVTCVHNAVRGWPAGEQQLMAHVVRERIGARCGVPCPAGGSWPRTTHSAAWARLDAWVAKHVPHVAPMAEGDTCGVDITALRAGQRVVMTRDFTLAADGSNVHELVAADEPEQLRAALTALGDSGERVDVVERTPHHATLRVRLSELCALLDRAACLAVLCEGVHRGAALVWWAPGKDWREPVIPALTTACAYMHTDTMCVLVEHGVLACVESMGWDRCRALVACIGTRWEPRGGDGDGAVVDEIVAPLLAVGRARRMVTSAVERCDVRHFVVWRAMHTALTAHRTDGTDLRMLRVFAAQLAPLRVLRAMEEAGVADFGARVTRREQYLGCSVWGEPLPSEFLAHVTWAILVPVVLAATACVPLPCVAYRVCGMWRRGALVHWAEHAGDAAKAEWLRARRAEGPLRRPAVQRME